MCALHVKNVSRYENIYKKRNRGKLKKIIKIKLLIQHDQILIEQ